jgi:hypothetical protein
MKNAEAERIRHEEIIVADRKDVEDKRNELEAKKKAAEDRKNTHARIIAEKKTIANT